MGTKRFLRGLLGVLLALAPAAQARPGHAGEAAADWAAKELPLPLAVKTAEDLRVKALAERHYLVFNLIGQGKVAWDAGDFAAAAARWEELLRVPALDPEVLQVMGPLAKAARARAGGARPEQLPPRGLEPPPTTAAAVEEPKPKAPVTATVSGTVSGGDNGPGGAVVMLHPADGKKLELRPAKGKVMLQQGKQFVPHVLAVPAGSAVSFKNVDPLFHNAFSLSPARKFDTDLYNQGEERTFTFEKAGVVEVLCNIHASMLGYVVVVDTPLFATAGANGAFSIKGVPPGAYEVEVWHESASAPARSKVTVTEEGARLSLAVGADKRPSAFPPDKYGKPRQQQLGY